MIRNIIEIDAARCNGCGICITACHEDAIGLRNGKAVLLRDDYCDGLGNCLPACPQNAIHMIQREAEAFDEAAVLANQKKAPLACGCPGEAARTLSPSIAPCTKDTPSQLTAWPIQLRLVSAKSASFDNADILLAADCSAFAMGNFHQAMLKNKRLLIACPKLDDADYIEKLALILQSNAVKSITILRMEVPCCGGLVSIAREAVAKSGVQIPVHIAVLSCDGALQ